MSHNHIDADEFRKFKATKLFDDVAKLRVSTGHQKNAFLRGEIENPIIRYPRLEMFDTEQKRTRLLILREYITAYSTHEVVRKLYLAKIDEKLKVLRMLVATQEGDDASFSALSREIYGDPTKETLTNVLQETYAVTQHILQNSSHSKIELSAERILTVIESLAQTSNIILLPDKIIQEEIPHQSQVMKTYNAHELKEMFEDEFSRKNIEWTVELSEYSTVRINQPGRTIMIPESRIINDTIVKKLIAHEIDVHIVRKIHGEQSPLALLSIGLDGYLKGEEGLAAYQEELATGIHPNISVSYIPILAALSFDGKERTFREIFNLIKDILIVRSARKGKEYQERKYDDQAWRRTLRIFRGTTGRTQGVCFTRDLIYSEGYWGIKKMFERNDPETKRMFIGKYNPLDSEHREALDKLGIQ